MANIYSRCVDERQPCRSKRLTPPRLRGCVARSNPVPAFGISAAGIAALLCVSWPDPSRRPRAPYGDENREYAISEMKAAT
jgi:hypothetical protein